MLLQLVQRAKIAHVQETESGQRHEVSLPFSLFLSCPIHGVLVSVMTQIVPGSARMKIRAEVEFLDCLHFCTVTHVYST